MPNLKWTMAFYDVITIFSVSYYINFKKIIVYIVQNGATLKSSAAKFPKRSPAQLKIDDSMSVFVKIISYKNLKDSGQISFDFPDLVLLVEKCDCHISRQANPNIDSLIFTKFFDMLKI